jgi:hypothetical protein
MWSAKLHMPIPQIMLCHDSGRTFNSEVSIEEFIDAPRFDAITVIESDDHMCVLKYNTKEVKTRIPYDV